MSRSRKKTPIIGWAYGEDKPARVADNRRVRRANRVLVRAGDDPIDRRTIGGPWTWPSDGRQYVRDAGDDLFRK